MRLLFRIFIVLPIAIVMLLFALANRHMVTVSFDPFPGTDIAGPQVTAPLFLALTLAGVAGVIVGGCAVWFGQGRWRRAARASRREAETARAETERVRAALFAAQTPVASPSGALALTSRRDAA